MQFNKMFNIANARFILAFQATRTDLDCRANISSRRLSSSVVLQVAGQPQNPLWLPSIIFSLLKFFLKTADSGINGCSCFRGNCSFSTEFHCLEIEHFLYSCWISKCFICWLDNCNNGSTVSGLIARFSIKFSISLTVYNRN